MTILDQVEDCRTAAALYSLGCLPSEERADFEQRLTSGCPLCTAEYSVYANLADELAQSETRLVPASTIIGPHRSGNAEGASLPERNETGACRRYAMAGSALPGNRDTSAARTKNVVGQNATRICLSLP
jgi:hypothetical protein